jgi:hypothetical protein
MKTRTFSLDDDTIVMLEKQSEKMHLSRSAYIRFLLVQHSKTTVKCRGV